MDTHTRTGMAVALGWSIVLIGAGLLMLRLQSHAVTLHVWQLAIIAAALGGLVGLTVAWAPDEFRTWRA